MMNFKIYIIGRKLHIDKITDEEVNDIDIDIHNISGEPRVKGVTDFKFNYFTWDSNKELVLRPILNDSKNMREVIITYIDKNGVSHYESNTVVINRT